MRITLREHAAKATDYSIRVALMGIFIAPIWFCLWWFTGFPPGGDASGLDPISDRVSQVLGFTGFMFLSPAYASSVFLGLLHISARGPFGELLHLLVGFVSVSVFWGTLVYSLVQLCRYVRLPPQRT